MKRTAMFALLALIGWWPMLTDKHWCARPVQQLRWLRLLIANAESWPPNHDGWEVHQARYRGHEVFVLNLCRYCGRQQGFLLYNHQRALIGQGEGADSLRLADLTNDRLLAGHPGRFRGQRKTSLLRLIPVNYGGPALVGVIMTKKDDRSLSMQSIVDWFEMKTD